MSEDVDHQWRTQINFAVTTLSRGGADTRASLAALEARLDRAEARATTAEHHAARRLEVLEARLEAAVKQVQRQVEIVKADAWRARQRRRLP